VPEVRDRGPGRAQGAARECVLGLHELSECDFTSNLKPVAKKCPECGSPYLVEKTLKSGIFLECPNKKKGAEEEVAPKKRGKKAVAAPAERGREGGVQLLEANWECAASADGSDTWAGGGEEEREEGAGGGVERQLSAFSLFVLRWAWVVPDFRDRILSAGAKIQEAAP